MDDRPDRCGLCRFWPRYLHAEQHDEEFGLGGGFDSDCRRHPPSPVVLPSPRGNPEVYTKWPKTRRTDWCGDFEPRPPRGPSENPRDGTTPPNPKGGAVLATVEGA